MFDSDSNTVYAFFHAETQRLSGNKVEKQPNQILKSNFSLLWLLKLQLFQVYKSYILTSGTSNLFKADKKVFGTASVDIASTAFWPNLDRLLAISSFWSGLRLESWKDLLQVWIYDTFAVQHLLRYTGVFSSDFEHVTFMFCLDGLALIIRFVYCYDCFPGLLMKKLSPCPLGSAAAFSLLTLGISLTLYPMSTFPAFVCLEWKNGVLELCVERQPQMAIKALEHHLDVVLVSLLVALDDFHILFWCIVWLWTGSCLGVRPFWTKACPKLLFKSLEQSLHRALIPSLATLDRFSSPYMYV